MKTFFLDTNLVVVAFIFLFIVGGFLVYQYFGESTEEKSKSEKIQSNDVTIADIQNLNVDNKKKILDEKIARNFEETDKNVLSSVNNKIPQWKEIFSLKEELVFDGTNNMIFKDDLSALHNGTPFEISFDMKLDDPNSKEYFGLMSTSNGLSASNVGFNISYDGKNHEKARMYLYMIKGSPGAIIDILSEDGVYPDNSEWQRVKIVYDGSVGKFYMNQKLSKESLEMNSNHSQEPHSFPFTIGSFASNEYYYKGRLRNISIKIYQ